MTSPFVDEVDAETARPLPPEGAAATPAHRPAAVSVRGRPVRRAPLGWLPWAALGLAALLALVTLLFVMNVADQSDDPGVDVTDDPTAQSSGTDAVGASASAPAPAPAGSAAGAGTVTAAGRALLPLPGDGLAPSAGQTAEGRGVRVESVVADEGFWVGSSTSDRIFVFLTDSAKAARGESPFQVKAGQAIDFTGVVRPVPSDVGTLGVTANEGADQLRQQGHYLELSRVALSG